MPPVPPPGIMESLSMIAPHIGSALSGIGALGSFLGGSGPEYDRGPDYYMYHKNWQRFVKTARTQMQWRVSDAKKAGLHPLAALGASIPQGPAAIPTGRSTRSERKDWSAFSKMGQTMAKLQIERQRLENESLRLGIHRQSLKVSNDGVVVEPAVVTSKLKPGIEKGEHAANMLYETDEGGVSKALSQKMAESVESDPIPWTKRVVKSLIDTSRLHWSVIAPNSKNAEQTRKFLRSIMPKKRKGYQWRINLMDGYWYSIKNDGKDRLYIQEFNHLKRFGQKYDHLKYRKKKKKESIWDIGY